MMMKRWGALLLVIVMTLALTACGNSNDTVVAEVGSVKITKGEALKVYDFLLKQIVVMYAQQGTTVSATDKTVIENAKTTTLSLMTDDLSNEQHLESLGIPLTEAEIAEIDTNAKDQYTEMIQTFMAQNGATEKQANDEATAQGLTIEAVKMFLRQDKVNEKLHESISADIVISDEDAQAEYEAKVTSQTETYANNPGQYGTDILNGTPVYVIPEGYRYVKNLVIGLPDDIQQQVDQKQQEAYAILYNQYMLNSQSSSQADMTDEQKKELEDQMATAQAEYDRLTAETKDLVAKGQEQALPQAEEILAKCKAPGADFDALMAEYSIDNPADDLIATHGYPVCAASTGYVPTFTEGCMALQNIGDISDLVASDYGFHILLYTGDIEPGNVPFEEVKEAIKNVMITTKSDELLATKKQEWKDSITITMYPEKL